MTPQAAMMVVFQLSVAATLTRKGNVMEKRYTLEQIRAMKGKTDWDALNKQGDFEGSDEDDFEVNYDKAKMVDGRTLTRKP